MRFALDETTQTLRAAVADVLRSEVTPAVIRAGWPGGDWAIVSGVWDKLADVGVIGTLLPEADGGLGLDENALVPVLEEIGYSGLPVPAVETIAVAGPYLTGRLMVAVETAPGEPVPFLGRAQRVVLISDGGLHVYETDTLEIEPGDSVDGSRWVGRVARQPEGGVLLSGDAAAAWQRGVLGTAAVLCGLARRMLDMTIGYVQRREQYGVPVGSFQAIKHTLADALVAVEFARPMVLAAGWAQSVGAADAALQTSAAKVLASDAARQVARTALQCHGAMGYTTEYDLHLFAKRAWALAPSWGSSAWHRARIGEIIA
ncbi:MAG TPA: acyl-CoA dehydrogenase [Streptosporangiaceae bacterium]|nr:acyl-CoA dehydrogenase [Streptosporangiaceae bacterium]